MPRLTKETFISRRDSHPGTVYSMEWSLGAEFWSRVLEWSGVRLWIIEQVVSQLQDWPYKIVYSMESSLGAEYNSEMEWSQILE